MCNAELYLPLLWGDGQIVLESLLLRRKVWAGNINVVSVDSWIVTQKRMKGWGLCEMELSQGDFTPRAHLVKSGDSSGLTVIGRGATSFWVCTRALPHSRQWTGWPPHNRGSPRPKVSQSC